MALKTGQSVCDLLELCGSSREWPEVYDALQYIVTVPQKPSLVGRLDNYKNRAAIRMGSLAARMRKKR